MITLTYFIFMGMVGAGIGWITNVVAIRLLFRPYRRCSIPLLGWTFQGLIPKRQNDIAAALGEIVSSELITGQDVALSLGREEIKDKIAYKVQKYVQERILDKRPLIIPKTVQLTLAEFAGKTLYQEVSGFLDDPQKMLNKNEIEDIKTEIKKIVEDKILSFDMKRLEEITYRLARTELKHIELLGGMLGFIIGLIQALITLYLHP